jgi:hypothetical protein
MKVFVRTSNLAEEKPIVIAFYPDTSNVKDDAHGDGVTVLSLPMSALVTPDPRNKGVNLYTLSSDWRQTSGSLSVKGEAKRRIEQVFSISDQLNALHEIIDIVVKHGADASRWPGSVRDRKIELDEKWNYIGEVRERVRSHEPAMPHNPGSDKAWPRRLAKK